MLDPGKPGLNYAWGGALHRVLSHVAQKQFIISELSKGLDVLAISETYPWEV